MFFFLGYSNINLFDYFLKTTMNVYLSVFNKLTCNCEKPLGVSNLNNEKNRLKTGY